MSTLPLQRLAKERELPDYLPARSINEYVYCPRLFYYEQAEGVFAESADTLEGSLQHKRVDRPMRAVDEETAQDDERPVALRSLSLSSEAHRVIAKLDLAELDDQEAVPVDYKHGAPRKTEQGLEAWPTDRAQLAVQALLLRENGYRCQQGVVFYQKTRQRVRVAFDEELMGRTEEAIRQAWKTLQEGRLPPPLIDSPKCPGCSLVGICMPDETAQLAASGQSRAPARQLTLFDGSPEQPEAPLSLPKGVRLLTAPRSELRPLYLNTQGLKVGKSGGELRLKEKEKLVQQVRLSEICQVNLMGNIQLTTQAVQALCQSDTPVCYFSQGGWFYGMTTGLNTKNVFLRKAQLRLSDQGWFCLRLARKLVAGKIRNQRTMLLRNHIEPPARELLDLKRLARRAEQADSLEQLLGLEGIAARIYFGLLGGMIKAEAPEGQPSALSFDFKSRNRRPPRDGINALLSLGYSLLAKDLTLACQAVGFDPMVGFYHQPRPGRPALALDLMEPLRPLIADSAVLTAVNTRMVTEKNLVQAGRAVSLNPKGRSGFFRAYELRMDQLVTHPLFDYRVSYRRLLEIQARLLAKNIEGEIGDYPVFVTR